MVKIGEK